MRTSDGMTPLIVATSNCHLQCIQLLVTSGADIDAKNNDGRTAVAIAAYQVDKDKSNDQTLLSLFKKSKYSSIITFYHSRGRAWTSLSVYYIYIVAFFCIILFCHSKIRTSMYLQAAISFKILQCSNDFVP